jgi:hypothetical protein
MKKFIVKSLLLICAVAAINLVGAFIGLYKLRSNYRYPVAGCVINQKSAGQTGEKILVIGCSNLQHNIDKTKVQQSIKNVDFIGFSGSQNSSFLTYLIDHHMTEAYKYIILYVPYHLFQKCSFIAENYNAYKEYGSYDYALDIIKHDPTFLFYNWTKLFDSIKRYRMPTTNTSFVAYGDKYIDSLNSGNNMYTNCNAPFIRNKHIIETPSISDEDVKFVQSLALKGQKVFILFTPIPNLKENIRTLEMKMSCINKLPNRLNDPVVLDSSYFYDQWYHVNKCGQLIETQKMIAILSKLTTL